MIMPYLRVCIIYIIVEKDGEVFPLINSLSSQSLLTVELIIATISPRRFLRALLATEVLDSTPISKRN